MIVNANFVPALVSTIIPVFNRATLLQEAVTSVLSQTYPHIEIIIVDDGSTDETAALCDQLKTKHGVIKVIHQVHDGRPGMVREAGRRMARGEYIQYLDSDDILQARKFEVMTRALADHPECDIAYCYTRRYQRGEPPSEIPCERTGETFDTMLPEFIKQRFWHTCTPLYTRRICDRAGAWSDLQFWEDVEYDMRIAAMGPRLCHCKEFLADFRDHGYARLSKPDFFGDRESMRHAPRAYRMIYEVVKGCGIPGDNENLRCFLNEVRSIADICEKLGLSNEAAQCLKVIDDANHKVKIDEKASELERSLAKADLHDQWAKDYLSDENALFFEMAFNYIDRVLNPPPNSVILDAGCGPCSHAIRLARRGFVVQAVDFSDAVLTKAKANVAATKLESRIKIDRENICSLSFGDESFNYILCWGVLMHVPDAEKSLAELVRVLRPGGVLVIGENNMYSIQAMIYRFKAKGNTTPLGVEYWGSGPSGPVLYRDANISWTIKWLRSHGFVIRKCVARQFTEVYVDVSSPLLKSLIHWFNNFWFNYIKIPYPAFGNLLVAEKVSAAVTPR